MRRAVALLLGTGACLVPAGTATAGSIAANVADHILTVTGSGEDDDITIRCEGGEVTVNQNQPDGGPEACDRLRRILVFAEGGDDRVSLGDVGHGAFGDLASVVVDGEGGDDTLIGSGLADHLDGGGGFDELRGGGGADTLSPGPGSGSAIGGKGHDEVSVNGNVDWLVDDERITRTPGGDEVTLGSIESVTVLGGRGDNTISTTAYSGDITAAGLGGDDRIATGAGHDHLDGGDGQDELDAGPGDDLLEGRHGADVLHGGKGDDELRGGPGPDACTGGPGADSELSCP